MDINKNADKSSNKARNWFKFKAFIDSNIPMGGIAPLNKLSDANIDIMIGLLQDIKNNKQD